MIKIKLASATSSISRYISGLWKGFIENDVDASVWYMDQKPAFDLFFEEKFDVLLIEEENIEHNPALLKCLFAHKNDVGVILKLRDNDLPNLDLPLHIGNRLYFISTNENLKSNNDIHLVRYAADKDFFHESNPLDNKEENSIVFVGRPSKYINSVLSKLCIPQKLNIRLFTSYECADNDIFPFIQYCGKLKYEQERQIYSESKWCLDIAEENQNFISQRCYEILACGSNLLTNNDLVSNITQNYALIKDTNDFPDNMVQGDENSKHLVDLTYTGRAKQILDLL